MASTWNEPSSGAEEQAKESSNVQRCRLCAMINDLSERSQLRLNN